jgi:hypothetical protein
MGDDERGTELDHAAQRVASIVERIFAALRVGAADAQTLWSRCAGSDGKVSTAELAQLRPSIQALLTGHPHFDGAGLVVDPSVLRDTTRYQEWWRPTTGGNYEFLDVNTGFGEDPYDYTTMSWFSGAAQGRECIRGPYVDLSGSDLYVLTFATPVDYHGTFIGVSGADITVANFENLMGDEFYSLGAEFVVVNGADRVVVSNSAEYSPGERMRQRAPSDVHVGGPGVNWRVHRL